MREHWQRAFLAALEIQGNVTASAKAAGVTPKTCYQHRRQNPDFAELWQQALERSADELEVEARKRAKAGSDVLLMFLLKGLKPQMYRESRATIPPSELNKLIENEFERLAKQKEQQEKVLVN